MTQLEAPFTRTGWFADEGAAFHRFLVQKARIKKRPITARSLVSHSRYLAENFGLKIPMFALGPEYARQEGDELEFQRIMDEASAYARKKDTQVLNSLAEMHGLDVRWDYETPPPSTHKVLAEERLRLLQGYRHDEDEVNARRRAFIHLETFVGARLSEIHNLRAYDVDREPGDLRIHIRKPAKRGCQRELPAPASLLAPTRPFGAWLRRRPIMENDEDLIWTTTQTPRGGTRRGNWYGGPARGLSYNYFAKEIRQIGIDLGFQLNCTVLRHTVATRLLRIHNFDISYVKLWLGHSDIKSTMVYVEVTYDDLARQLQRSHGVDLFHATR